MNLPTRERRMDILEKLRRLGVVQGASFARFYKVDLRTIQRDIAALRESGHRIHIGSGNSGYVLRQGDPQ